MRPNDAPAPVVELIGITKRFGRVLACDDVDLTLHAGRIHGIVGENGAGKSTLMNVLFGLVAPDAGQVLVDGRPVRIGDPADAARLGIGMVHQHLSLVEPLTVWENVALGDTGRFDPRRIRSRVAEISEQYGLAIDPDDRVCDLSAGMRQRVEIVKCLRRDPRVLIFDEPTSVLTPAESEVLFGSLRQVVADGGKTVALVTHNLVEVLSAADEVTIMRDGRVQECRSAAGADVASLARAMVGRPVRVRGVDASAPALRATAGAEPVLELRGLRATGRDGRVLLDGLDLALYPGEIVGLAGIEGNGQRALGDVLSSLLELDAGTVRIAGRTVPTGVAGAMDDAGIAIIPEDRHDSGCVLEFSVAENLVLNAPGRVATRGVIDLGRLRATARDLIERYDISCDGPDAPMWTLSGGNQQRAVVARELSHDPPVLVAAQPTRGLDVGAVEYMSAQLHAAADRGTAVLLISTELDEILDLADRAAVIRAGRIVGSMGRGSIDLEHIGLLMAGAVDDVAPAASAGGT